MVARFVQHMAAVGCDKLAGVLLPAHDDDGERRHTTMRLALVFQRFGPCSGVPALAVTFPRRPTDFQASLSHPTEKVSELRTVIYWLNEKPQDTPCGGW